MRNLFIIISIFFLYTTYLYSKEGRIVYLDMDLLMSKSLAGKSINTQIKNNNNKNIKKLKKIEDEIKKEDENISSQKNILSKEELNKKVSKLNLKIENYRNMINKNKENNKNSKIIATKKLVAKLNPILSEYSEKNSISLIFQKRDIIIGKNNLNITDDIIKILDENVKTISIE